MSTNRLTVSRYMEAFRRSERAGILACLMDDVRWRVPGAFESAGKAAFGEHVVDEGFVAGPEISVTRLTEEGDVVVADGTVRTQRTDGTILDLAFCDAFELRDGLIAELTSYLVAIPS